MKIVPGYFEITALTYDRLVKQYGLGGCPEWRIMRIGTIVDQLHQRMSILEGLLDPSKGRLIVPTNEMSYQFIGLLNYSFMGWVQSTILGKIPTKPDLDTAKIKELYDECIETAYTENDDSFSDEDGVDVIALAKLAEVNIKNLRDHPTSLFSRNEFLEIINYCVYALILLHPEIV